MMEDERVYRDEILDMSIGPLMSTIGRTYLIFLSHEIDKYGIHAGQLQFLIGLSKKDSISQGELANTYHTHQSTVARDLKKLEDVGMISRKADENNRRKNVITITPKGRNTVDNIRLMDEKWENDIKSIESLTVDEKNKLKEFLRNFALEAVENIENYLEKD